MKLIKTGTELTTTQELKNKIYVVVGLPSTFDRSRPFKP